MEQSKIIQPVEDENNEGGDAKPKANAVRTTRGKYRSHANRSVHGDVCQSMRVVGTIPEFLLERKEWDDDQ